MYIGLCFIILKDKTQGLCEEFQVDGDGTTTFEFYCTGQCAEADVTFWYRYAY